MADWVTFARAINMSVFQDQFQHGIPALKWFTQLYWAAIALMAAGAVLARPLRYWLSFPANLFPVLVVYWTMFHMAFFGTGRFSTPKSFLSSWYWPSTCCRKTETGWRGFAHSSIAIGQELKMGSTLHKAHKTNQARDVEIGSGMFPHGADHHRHH